MATPIQELQDAVQRYVEQVDGGQSVVSGFVLEYELSSFTDEQDVEARLTATDYTTGPGTTLATAMGLARMLVAALDDVGSAGSVGRIE